MPSTSDLAPGTEIGEYKLEAKIGEGGMGSVYSVVHPLIGKRAAIKIMAPHLCNDATAIERFIYEASSVNSIGHPNIVDVFAFGKLPDGRSYFIMEWLQGESLAAKIARGPMSAREVADIVVQTADALDAAHEKHVVHRDLKPDNVFLVPVRGRRTLVKLLDFGIAKLVGTQLSTRKTRTGTFVGTPGYTSPEQARSNQVQPQCDIYALGVTTYEMLTGKLPFDADNPFEIVHMHLYNPPPAVQALRPDVPEMIDALIRMMMAKDAKERPSLEVVAEVMAEWRDQLQRERSNTPLGVPVRVLRDMTPVPIKITPSEPLPLLIPEGEHAEPIVGAPAGTYAPIVTPPSQPTAKTPAPNATAAAKARTPSATATPHATPSANPTADKSTSAPRPVAEPWPGTPERPRTNTPSVAVEVFPRQPRQRRQIMAIGAACAVVGVTITLLALRAPSKPPAPEPKPAVLVVRQTTTPAPPAPSPPPVPAPAPQSELVVHANVDNAVFTLDGQPLAEDSADLRTKLDLDGPHKLVVSAPKHQPATMTVYLRRGESVEVNAKLAWLTRAAPAAPGNAEQKSEPKGESKNYVLDPFHH